MEKITKLSLTIFALLGFLKIFSIIPFNRMAADDFSSLLMTRLGFWNDLVVTYTTSIGRFSGVVTETLFMLIFGFENSILIYSVITFTLLFAGFAVFIKRAFNLVWKDITLYILSAGFVSVLYLLTPNKQESWYWLTGSVIYLWPIIVFLFSSSFLFLKKARVSDYVLSCLLAFFATSYNESFGLIILVLFLGILARSILVKKFNKLSFALFTSSLASFSIMFLAPANRQRMMSPGSEPMSFLGSILYSIKDGPYVFFNMLIDNIFILVSLFIVLTFLFSSLKKHAFKKTSTEKSLENIFYVILFTLFLCVVYMLPGYFGLGRTPPDRSFITLCFLALGLVVYIAFEVCGVFKFHKIAVLAGALLLIISAGKFTNSLSPDLYIAKNYSERFDLMIEEFRDRSKRNDKSEILVSLPVSGLVAEVIDKPGVYSYKNQALSEYFGVGKITSIEYENK